MKLLNKMSLLSLACLAVVACSGGNSTPSGGATPNPTPTVPLANTSVAGYLPFGAGDKWTFTTGATLTDMGSSALSCTCTVNGISIERMDLDASGGSYTGSLIYAKGMWPLAPYTGHAMTYLVGLSENEGASVSLFYVSGDGTIPGIPAIDDTPTAGESFSLPPPPGTGSGSMTISSIGNTQQLGAARIINVADTTLMASVDGSETTTSFNYAPGVGFTIVALAAGPMTLQSFSLAGAMAASAGRANAQSTRVTQVDTARLAGAQALTALLTAWAR